jgi:ribosomal protein L37AE/L43A
MYDKEDQKFICTKCYINTVSRERVEVTNKTTCLPCGEEIAREKQHTVLPMHKSNYVFVSHEAQKDHLKTNPKLQ